MDRESLKAALANPDETERLYAVEDIISLREESLISELIEALLTEESRMVKELMVEGLKVLNTAPHFTKLSGFFESSDAFIRNCAIEIFGAKGEDAVPFLTCIMDHSDKEVRKLILDSLVATGSKYCIPALRAALNDKAPNVQITAVEYLGKINDEESLPEIMQIFQSSREPMLRASCIETFILFGKGSTVDTVLETLGGSMMDSFYKPSVFRLVSECGSRSHLPFMLGYLNNRNSLFFNEIAGAILKIMIRDKIDSLPDDYEKYVLSGMKNPDFDTDSRIAFMSIVFRLALPEKEEIFTELARDGDESLMLAALYKLAELNKNSALAIIDAKLESAEGEAAKELENLRYIVAEQ